MKTAFYFFGLLLCIIAYFIEKILVVPGFIDANLELTKGILLIMGGSLFLYRNSGALPKIGIFRITNRGRSMHLVIALIATTGVLIFEDRYVKSKIEIAAQQSLKIELIHRSERLIKKDGKESTLNLARKKLDACIGETAMRTPFTGEFIKDSRSTGKITFADQHEIGFEILIRACIDEVVLSSEPKEAKQMICSVFKSCTV